MVMKAGAVKYGLEARLGLVESGEFCRGLAEREMALVEVDLPDSYEGGRS